MIYSYWHKPIRIFYLDGTRYRFADESLPLSKLMHDYAA